ncbi:MAG TPA: CHRD domain-containing protein [Solirubrobacteraceae bacterium]|nr:CHRD domain-containing protein [Solirubrobacteraceae bacterium]
MTQRTGSHLAAAAVIATTALGVVGCGGASAVSNVVRSRPSELYTVALSGRAQPRGGARHGRGFAIIAFHGRKVVCWRFAHLHGFTTATHAAIYAAAAGSTGPVAIALTGPPRLHHRGCIATTAATSAKIVRDPRRFYVDVFAARFPHGAVRGQL